MSCLILDNLRENQPYQFGALIVKDEDTPQERYVTEYIDATFICLAPTHIRCGGLYLVVRRHDNDKRKRLLSQRVFCWDLISPKTEA